MPLAPGASRKIISSNIKELHSGKTFAHTSAKFGKSRADKQAVAIALSEASREPEGIANRAMGGPTGVGGFNMAKEAHMRPSFVEGSEMRKLTRGPILSAVSGRTDAHKSLVPSSSYVIPADIVSGRGQGNTLAGMNVLQKMFKMGPYGTGLPNMRPGHSMPHPMSAPRPMAMMANGGAATHDEHGNKLVPVDLAGGELVVPPENLRAAVHPDLKTAHEIMDRFVLNERKKLRKTLGKLPGPAKD